MADTAPPDSPMALLPLETERLLLRPYRQDDAAAVARLLDDAAMADFLMVIPQPFVDFDARQLVKAAWRRLATGRGFDLLAVLKPGDGAPLGSVGIGLHDGDPQDGGRRGELGFWIGRDWWGRGYGTEAARRMVEFAQDTLGVSPITATAAVSNPASRRILEKLGFVETGRDVKQAPSSGEARDVILYELSAVGS